MESKNIELKMVPNKDGVLVPEDTVEPPCAHAEVAERYGRRFVLQTMKFHCKDCHEKVQVRIMNFVILKEDEMEAFLKMMEARALAMQAEAQRKKAGIVLPGEK